MDAAAARAALTRAIAGPRVQEDELHHTLAHVAVSETTLFAFELFT